MSTLKQSLIAQKGEWTSQYDYCMVFSNEEDKASGNVKHSDIAKFFVNQMKEAGLELFTYHSVQGDELIVLIRCPPEVMKKFADQIDFKMELNPTKVKSLLEEGFIEGEGDEAKYIYAPIKINEDPKFSPIPPYMHIFGKYDQDLPQDLYADFEVDPNDPVYHEQVPFNRYIRLKLIYYMLKAPKRIGGCDIELSKLLHKKRIKCFYPLHDREFTEELNKEVMAWECYPWSLPFDKFRNYFGEKITLYTVFMGHYSYWLIIPSIIGFIFQLVVWGTVNFSSPVLPFFCLIICVWTILMLENWKRNEKMTSMRWGMLDFESKEPDRPEFKGDLIDSYVDGQPMLYFSPAEFTNRILSSQSVILTFVVMVLGVVSSIYVLRFSLQSTIGTNASTVASIMNTVQITVFNIIYQYVAIFLTNKENHRTDTQYEDALIVKLFMFQFINSYASFFFLAFIASYLDKPSDAADDYVGECGYANCMQPLSINLAIIFGTRLVIKNLTDLLIPYIMGIMKRKEETKGAEDKKLTPAEEDYVLQQYDSMIEGIQNYADAAIQFGFSVLFVSALPIAPFFSLLSNYVRAKVNTWKLNKLYQRPIPMGAQDIGSWLTIFQFISVASVITNAGLICFTMDVLDEYSLYGRVWVFIGFQWTLIFIQFVVEQLIPDVPEEVEIQESRMEFITSKIIDHTPDEDTITVKDYKAQLGGRQISVSEVEPGENVTKGFLCFKETVSSTMMKKKNYGGSPEIVVQTYPTQSSTSTLTRLSAVQSTVNPMMNKV